MTDAERTAASQARRRSVFCGRLSHQLAGPLNVILNGAEYIQTSLEKGSPAQQQSAILVSAQAIQDSARWLDRLAQNLLDVLAICSDSFAPSLAPVELSGQLGRLLELCVPYVERQQMTLEWSSLPQQAMVWADEALTDRVLLNLLSNSIRFGHPGGRIFVELQAGEERCTIALTDDGPGISDEAKKAVQDPFRELEAQDFQQGSGIGLYLAAEFCRAMSWELHLDGSGAGTRAEVVIPRSAFVSGEKLPEQVRMASGTLYREMRRQEQLSRVCREMDPLFGQPDQT